MWTRIARTAVSTLAIAAAALAASPARADHDRDERRGGWREGRSVAPAPAPVVVVPGHVRPSPPLYAPAPPAVVMTPWRFAHWRTERRFDELRHEYRELELARGHFYATWDGRPWTRDRFEGWYASRRAELDGRAVELARWRR